MLEERDALALFVSPYHPDSLRQPSGGPVSSPSDRLRDALTWNVFRTFEQIAPTLWLRPLVARLTGLPDNYDAAPNVTLVSCWRPLDPAPAALLRRARRSAVPTDVIVSTDDTVLTFVVPSLDELTSTVLSDTAEGGLLDLIEATCWYAGTRSAYTGVVLPIEADGDVWASRVRHRAERVRRVLQASARGVENARGIGAITWASLADVLSQCAESRGIAEAERRLAKKTATWVRERLRQRSSAFSRLA